jgi:hypothetical protein
LEIAGLVQVGGEWVLALFSKGFCERFDLVDIFPRVEKVDRKLLSRKVFGGLGGWCCPPLSVVCIGIPEAVT